MRILRLQERKDSGDFIKPLVKLIVVWFGEMFTSVCGVFSTPGGLPAHWYVSPLQLYQLHFLENEALVFSAKHEHSLSKWLFVCQ